MRAGVGHMVKIELEVDTLAQLERRWHCGSTPCCSTTWVPTMLREAVGMVDGRMITEASGRIRPDTAAGDRRHRGRPDVDRLADAQRDRCWISGSIIAAEQLDWLNT